MFDLTVDFHDGAPPVTKRLEGHSDLAQYLEGVTAYSKLTIHIETVPTNDSALFDLPWG